MKAPRSRHLVVTVVTACLVAALAAPAMGQGDDITLRRDGSRAVPFVADLSKRSNTSSDITLRRDGSKAVPFVADLSKRGDASSDITLRRDGSKAVPFVADLRPDASAQTSRGFHWRDAAFGAGIGVAAVLVLAAAATAVRRRGRPFAPRATAAARRHPA